jgi:hypothetical protein
MDAPVTPPPLTLPTPRGPLGRTFVITLLAPLAPLILCLIGGLTGDRSWQDSLVPWALLMLSLPVMLGCSIACAIQVGTRKGAGLGVLTFIGTQILYIGTGFAGCVASIKHMDFK